jgi:hypothetical protein
VRPLGRCRAGARVRLSAGGVGWYRGWLTWDLLVALQVWIISLNFAIDTKRNMG